MQREAVEDFIAQIVESIIKDTEMELVDVDFVRERDWYLRVYLDKPGGVDLDDCQLVSEKLSAELDVKDPIKENYLLEVSSPGLDRVLKKDKDFIRYNNREIDVQFFKPWDGQKMITATLTGFTKESLHVLINEQQVELNRSDIAQIRLHLDF